MKDYKLSGYVTVPGNISFDEFVDCFIDFVESKDWAYCGSIREVNEEANK